ncbi:MAG TPA: DNA translocase FtsK 4TM domain-containing protein [Chitinophagales bacterium]|nr:DNA translocase FtsK 4TM domain-containing protein [Chitinophagales bacterium]HNF68022.1 DNA translocase FtsK 4TM domain-containing protein [Chitinophagales bacterium]HNM07788.1 DNA translocase FtsK 4TM domain-containing protein [Chitinophagales bacterium]HNM29375.1 DNA translocase FtsK 4TM domain-containing protein [Chitinophagales bacterium]HNO28475.1 DNA translocase FtsK 4TM domain-containing protein [Chitinophagales bacterium]
MAETKKSGKKAKKASNSAPFYKDERILKVTGVFLLLLSFFSGVSFVSYLFTWKADQSLIWDHPWAQVFNSGITVENHLGNLGAVLSHQFFFCWFGVASFFFVVWFFTLGVNFFFSRQIFNNVKLIGQGMVVMAWISTMLGFFMYKAEFPYGGGFGKGTAFHLESYIGKVGAILALTAAMVVYMIIFTKFDFGFLLNMFRKKEVIPAVDPFTEDDMPVQTEEIPEVEKEMINVPPVYTSNVDITPLQGEVDDVVMELKKVEPVSEQSMPLEIEEPETIVIAGDEEPLLDHQDHLSLDIETPVEEQIAAENLNYHFDPVLDLPNYKYPELDLLEEYASETVSINTEELERNKDQIIATLNNYNIQISKIKATIGPTVTLYEIIPAAGVRISKIKNLEDDIALSLAALGIRIIAPIPGKGTIGIEVPNVNKETVSMKSQIGSDKFQHAKMDLPVCLGKTISSENYIADLTRMPHLLMAGATGQGKSVGINAILISLLYKKHPSQLKFVMVDPKKVELSLFSSIEKHFLAKLPGEEDAIITDTRKVVNTLNALCIEMDTRYELLKNAQVRNIKEYNAKFMKRKLNPKEGHMFLPYIVLVIDEFADLIMTAGKEVEMPIARIAQLARAVGLHCVIATQRPSVNIITGTIKANFPARIAFKVASKVDSRTILDNSGAEQLVGRGDMLLAIGSDMVRLQCPFVDTPEVDKVVDFISDQIGYPEAFMLPEFIDEQAQKEKMEIMDGERDPLFAEAAKIIVQHQQGSTSLIQRRLKLGYNRAGRLMDQLEAAGIVGQSAGSKPREVLYSDLAQLEQYLQTLD